MQGKLILFCGPSGSGKTTIVHHLLKNNPRLAFSVSATTRSKRETETNGIDYHFLSIEEFKEKINCDEFVEWEEVYQNGYYGTLKEEIEKIWKQNKRLLTDSILIKSPPQPMRIQDPGSVSPLIQAG